MATDGVSTNGVRPEAPDQLSASEGVVLSEPLPIPGTDAYTTLITLNRPSELNAINEEMVSALDDAISAVEHDPHTRAVLITGTGRAFSAGGDLKAYIRLQKDAVRFPAFVESLHATFGRLRNLRVPVVALVNGVTAAGGLELLLNCDFGIAAESARIGDGHLNYGQMGGGGVLSLLPRFVGISKATELVLSGRFLESVEAAEWGLVSAVVPDAELLQAGTSFAAAVARKSPLAVASAKSVMNTIWTEAMALSPALRLERERNCVYCLTSEDAPEGLIAFSEKREPRFVGR